MYYPRLYGILSGPWRRMRNGATWLTRLDRVLVALIAIVYYMTVMWVAAMGDGRWLRALIVPAATLVIVSFLRWIINAPRPYETFNVDPLLPDGTLGKSLPSRHVACAVVIAFALGWIKLSWGIEMGAAALLVCYTRLAGGMHFPRDVIAGIALACVCGLIGFYVIP